MAGFRNILVHEYAEVAVEDVYRFLRKNLGDLTKFVSFIKNYIEGKDIKL